MCHTKCRQCYWAPAVKIYNDLVFKATSQPMQFLGKKQKNVKCLSIGQKILSDYWHLKSYECGKEPCAVSSWPWAIPPTHQKDLVSCLWWSEFSLRDCKKKGFLPRKGRTFFQDDLCALVEAKMWGALLLLTLYASESLADECFCSGVTTQCREATTYYWATLRQAI